MFKHNLLIKRLIITSVLLFLISFKSMTENNLDTTCGWKPYCGIPGADTASSYKISNCKFFVYDDYMIVENELTGGEIGSNIFVKFRKGKAFPEVNCDKTARNCNMKVLNKWAEFFLAKKDNFLIIQSESGLQEKLIIYDIRTKKVVFESNFSELTDINSSGELSFWLKTDKANQNNCPEYNELKNSGYNPVIEKEVYLDLKTQNLSYSSDMRCNYKE